MVPIIHLSATLPSLRRFSVLASTETKTQQRLLLICNPLCLSIQAKEFFVSPTGSDVIAGDEYMGGVIKNVQNDNEKSAAGLPDDKGAKIVKGLTKGIFSVVKLQDDDLVLKMDDEPINNIDDFRASVASGKTYKTISVWWFQKMVLVEMPDPASIPLTLDKRDWKVVSADSEASGYDAKKAIDGDSRSFWHTEFEGSEPPFPHELVVDMGGESIMHSLEYLARQGSTHPRIKDYQLFLSTDGKNWGQPVLQGKLKDSEDLQHFPINKVKSRYFKLIGVTGYTRNDAAVGEISFQGTSVPQN